MPDAWETLIGNSTLGSGDAWEHLNAQGGGSGTIIVSCSISAEISNQVLASRQTPQRSAEMGLALSSSSSHAMSATVDRMLMEADLC